MTDEAVMAQQSSDSEAGAPSPPQRTTPCPKCGAVNWYWEAKRRTWRCRPCRAQEASERFAGRRKPSRRCLICGTPRPQDADRCLSCKENGVAAVGERRVRERFNADYVDLLLQRPEAERRALFLRFGYASNIPARAPKPSTLFPTIAPGLDERLVRDGTDIDVVCLRTLGALPRSEQGAFYDRYRQDPAQALQWAQLPAWKRPIMAGDPEDQRIWKLFTILRLKAEWCARFNEQGLAEEGYQLARLAGLLESVTNPRRLGMVLALFGGALRDGVEVGDVMHPPWPPKP